MSGTVPKMTKLSIEMDLRELGDLAVGLAPADHFFMTAVAENHLELVSVELRNNDGEMPGNELPEVVLNFQAVGP